MISTYRRQAALVLSSPVGSYSPSERASAPAQRISDKTRQARPWRRTARPLAVQRLAAGLVAITHGLDRAHIGAICDALTATGIDPDVWSARAVNDKLNADMRARGLTWPDHIANPGAFLHSRLRRLSWSPPEARDKGQRLRRRQHRPDAATGGAHRGVAGSDRRGPRRDPPRAHRQRSTHPQRAHQQHAQRAFSDTATACG